MLDTKWKRFLFPPFWAAAVVATCVCMWVSARSTFLLPNPPPTHSSFLFPIPHTTYTTETHKSTSISLFLLLLPLHGPEKEENRRHSATYLWWPALPPPPPPPSSSTSSPHTRKEKKKRAKRGGGRGKQRKGCFLPLPRCCVESLFAHPTHPKEKGGGSKRVTLGDGVGGWVNDCVLKVKQRGIDARTSRIHAGTRENGVLGEGRKGVKLQVSVASLHTKSF